jgi:F-type H+-transporting ATPase subunit b
VGAQQRKNTADKTRQQPGPDRELAEVSNEAAGREPTRDEHAQFKYSAMVRGLAQKTGLSVEAAYWLSIALNFIFLGLVLRLIVKKGIPTIFPPFPAIAKDRTSTIQKGLEEARRASEDAQRRLNDIENRLSHLDSEIAGIRSNAESQAAEEEVRLRAAVEEERQKILRSAEQEISSAAGNARRELTAYAAELSIGLAEKRIKLDAATDAEILRDFVEQLSSDGNERRRS